MSTINEIGRANGKAYGVKIYVCGNAEVISLATVGGDPSGNGWNDEARKARAAATTVLFREHLDYEIVREFSAYNGGSRRGLVEEEWFEATIETTPLEDGEEESLSEWKPTTKVPDEFHERVDLITAEAWEAITACMEAAAADRTDDSIVIAPRTPECMQEDHLTTRDEEEQ